MAVAGNQGESYRWSQTEEEVVCEISVNKLLEKGGSDANWHSAQRSSLRSLFQVRLTSKDLEILYNAERVFSAELTSPVDLESSTWYFEDSGKEPTAGPTLVIMMEKRKKGWWDSCFKGGPRIDLGQIENKKNLSDLDDRTRSEIIRVLAGSSDPGRSMSSAPALPQLQARLPTSEADEAGIASILEQAWNEENSPFKGTKYDPELVKDLIRTQGVG
ncbi:hypothetical protein HWI79_2068, partial [Cryptosporidium felis]